MQNFIEILRIHEDYVTTTKFTLTILNGLLVLVAPNCRNREKKSQKTKDCMFWWRGFTRLRGGKMMHCQFARVHKWNPFESRSTNCFFPLFPTPLLPVANKALEHLQKTSEKTGSEIVENGLLSGSERRKQSMAALRWISVTIFCNLTECELSSSQTCKPSEKHSVLLLTFLLSVSKIWCHQDYQAIQWHSGKNCCCYVIFMTA